MTIMTDGEIIRLQEKSGGKLISPFSKNKQTYAGVSYGLGSCSYDLRLGTGFKSMRLDTGFSYQRIDTMEEKTCEFETIEIDTFVSIYPGQFILAHTVESVSIPSTVCGTLKDKSTWARYGLQVKNTLVDPGFIGQLTLEISNEGTSIINLYPGMGICQLVLERLAFECLRPYNGKYQHQSGVTAPILEFADND